MIGLVVLLIFTICFNFSNIQLEVSSLEISATEISDCFGLQNMALDLNGDYVLVNDVECSDIMFVPIGTGGAPFTGSLDGGGRTISGLVSSYPTTMYVGLFGLIENAQVFNLNIINAYVYGLTNVGILAGGVVGSSMVANVNVEGYVEGVEFRIAGLVGILGNSSELTCASLVTGCHANVNVSAKAAQSVAGLVGSTYCSISDSSATGSILGLSRIGGIVGTYVRGDIFDSYASVDVVGMETYVGGFAGYMYQNNQWINRCYATGSVSGFSNVGGFVGHSSSAGFVYIDNSYATGDVQASLNVGGFGGVLLQVYISNSYSTGFVSVQSVDTQGGFISDCSVGLVTNSYWDKETSGISEIGCGEGKTTFEMKQQFNFINWDFSNVWTIVEGNTYPFLRVH